MTRERDNLAARVKELSNRVADSEAEAASVRTTQVGVVWSKCSKCVHHAGGFVQLLPVVAVYQAMVKQVFALINQFQTKVQ